MAIISAKLWRKLQQALLIQALLMLVATPFLIAWGVPIAILSPVGNLIFTPWLLLFLALALLVTGCELLAIPNQGLIAFLETVTTYGLKLMSWGSPDWLVGFPLSSLWGFSFLALATVACISLLPRPYIPKTLAGLSFLAALYGAYVYLTPPSQTESWQFTLKPKYALEIQYQNGQLILIDKQRCLAQLADPVQWCEQQLQPALYQRYGTVKNQRLVLVNPTSRIQQLIPALQQRLKLQAVQVVPKWPAPVLPPPPATVTVNSRVDNLLAAHGPIATPP